MNIKKQNAIAGIDAVIAIITIIIFSTLILTLIVNNLKENVKLKKDTLAMIYITEIFENIAIEDYDKINDSNIDNLIPQQVKDNYSVDIKITNQFENVSNNEDIMKKITLTLTYEFDNEEYSCSMERMKIRE